MFIRKADYDKLVKSNREGWDKVIANDSVVFALKCQLETSERQKLVAQTELAGASMERVARVMRAEELEKRIKDLEERLGASELARVKAVQAYEAQVRHHIEHHQELEKLAAEPPAKKESCKCKK